ncbi:TonB-dependent receptor [uncultured Alistipes sp.]|jgi:TonB-linked SusC/RagA family outer membrane protein|uniref:SusC/RagA family TonB-linked outer membrane protein n=1 Tax=uncultured Alistipes sp. TaxID=538949 RepID=UPI0025DD21AC|nr:TonB-dependent receptor [uncultured Alistipes sp.]
MVRKIVLSLIAALGLYAYAFAQNKQVSGTVAGADGSPIAGATVLVEGTATGTTTGANGSFTVSAPANGVLTVSFLGYETQKVAINNRSNIQVKLLEDAKSIDDVVVIGYGSGQRIGNIVGSVSTVSAGEIADRPSANIGDALQGKVPGLQIFNTSGEPQSSVSIRLRGESSLNLSNAPLYILDGVPVSSSVFTSINPQDIENISILKDASSTAIYGSRAANGVIFVSTKKGKKGDKPSISLRAQYGVSMLTNYNMDMMNSEQLIRFEEMCVPSLKTDAAYQAKKAFILGNGINFDWQDYLFDSSAPLVQADASIRGATESTNYYVSLGYYSEQGTAKANSSVDRFTFRSNLDTQISKWLKFGANVALTYNKYHTITTGWYSQSPILQSVTGLPYYTPYELIYNEDGTVSYGKVQQVYPWDNMIDLNEYYKYNTNDRENVNLMGQTYFQLTPVKGLTIRAQQAIDAFDYTNESINMPSYTPYTYRGRNSQAFQRYYQLSSTNTIEYKNNINQKHFFTALIGHESIIKRERTFNAVGTGLTDDRLTAFKSTTAIDSWGGNVIECAFNSFFANFNYNYDGKYFLDASVRTDGSSLFGKNHRYATFYSVGAMWKLKQENFLKDVSWVNDLNLNVSYGTTGNSGLDSWYASLGLVGTGPKYNGNAGWALSQVPNADLTWETVATLNVGVSGRLADRVSFGFEFYNKVSTDLLMEMPYSGTTGHSSGWGNIASMRNRGIDLELSVDLIHTKDVFWSITGNVNYNKNEITKLYQGLDELAFPDYGLKYQVGKPSSLVYTQVRAGVDPNDGAPMWYDLNGNLTKTYSDDIMQFCGMDTNAPWSGGFSTAFSWKGLGLNMDFSWIGERWIFINERYYTMNPANQLQRSNFETKMLNMWTTPGQKTDIPKYGTQFYFDTSAYSNASFIRMKNISLSYSFPKSLIQKSGFLSSVKVYVTGRNLWTITDFEGYDPEVGYSNATQGMYPNSRQIVFGAELVF